MKGLILFLQGTVRWNALKHCVSALLLAFGIFNSPQMLSSVANTLWDSLEACSGELINKVQFPVMLEKVITFCAEC